MKKIYLLIVLALAGFAANAQCTPDTAIKQPGYYPYDLDTAKTGVSYNMVLHFRIPNDTQVIFGGVPVTATFDSIRLTSVTGLPSGFTYQCNSANCNFVPKQTFCAKISGNPTSQQAGTYPLKLAILAYAKVGPLPVQQPDTIRRFTLIVSQNGTTSIADAKPYTLNIYPNPATHQATLWMESNEALVYTLTDIIGKLYVTQPLQNTDGLQTAVINLQGLAKGFYFVRIIGERGSAVNKLMVE